jgi:hypothetical protein
MVKLLLDIDGVFNPMFVERPNLRASFAPVQHDWGTWLLDSDLHRTWLLQLEQEAEIIWVSSWEETSNYINKHFGLASATYPHITFGQMFEREEGTWKLPAIKRLLKGDRDAVVLIDDELQDDARQWAAARPNTLLIEPKSDEGLTEAQYLQVLEFVRAHPSVSDRGGWLSRLLKR